MKLERNYDKIYRKTLRYVSGYNKSEAKSKSYELLESVGVTPAKKRAKQYPYEFSGRMLQRSMIALAIACNPKLLIADEATTALMFRLCMMAVLLKHMMLEIYLIHQNTNI
ncbi:MAG: ATP-binding cassette domain-containing protein [Eubacterium sp.]|nr:ATP-binding cassette domain-containing protein [Eubacterium sp.]